MMQTITRLNNIASEALNYIIADTIDLFEPLFICYTYCYITCLGLQAQGTETTDL